MSQSSLSRLFIAIGAVALGFSLAGCPTPNGGGGTKATVKGGVSVISATANGVSATLSRSLARSAARVAIGTGTAALFSTADTALKHSSTGTSNLHYIISGSPDYLTVTLTEIDVQGTFAGSPTQSQNGGAYQSGQDHCR